MPPALKALLAQFAGWAAALLLARTGMLPLGLWPLVAVQAGGAAVAAAALRSARWWLPIHLAFTPLAVVAQGLGLAPAWYLGAFLLLVAVYWSSFRTQVPLYLSNRPTVAAVAKLLPPTPASVLDLGSGTGSLLRPLAVLRPDCSFTGIEAAPGPCWIARLLGRRRGNLHFARGDFFRTTWASHDLVYAFLSPVPMEAVWHKARREMAPGALLVSNSFTVPGVAPAFVVEVGDRRRTHLYGYRPAGAKRQE